MVSSDDEDLLPGQDWAFEIRKGDPRQQSRTGVPVEGFNHDARLSYKEMAIALDVAEEQPQGAEFIVPVLLEECEVPERLRRWHWVSLFVEGRYERLLNALLSSR